jgi:hypothetical protein
MKAAVKMEKPSWKWVSWEDSPEKEEKMSQSKHRKEQGKGIPPNLAFSRVREIQKGGGKGSNKSSKRAKQRENGVSMLLVVVE